MKSILPALLACAFLFTACTKAAEPTPVAKPVAHPVVAPPAKPAATPCTKPSDCGLSVDLDLAGCSVTCVSDDGGDGPRHCVVLTPGAGVGARSCFGTDRGNERRFSIHRGSREVSGVICDRDGHGAVCDEASRTCVKAKGLGEPVGEEESCGKDLWRSEGTCAAAAKEGERCKGVPCVTTARCDSQTNRCVPNAPLGAKCSAHDDCASVWCKNEVCVEHPPAAASMKCELGS